MSTHHRPTNADRLDAIVARLGPAARYVIHTLPDGGRKIVVTNHTTGDAVGAVGSDIGAAITALAAKVPAPTKEA